MASSSSTRTPGRLPTRTRSCWSLLGYSCAELLGKHLWDIGLFGNIDTSRASFRELQEKGYVRYEDLPLETKDGRHVEVEFVSNVYRVNDQMIIQCNIRDITARKRAEEEVRQANEANEAAGRAKDRFLATLSHELRTPLTPVLATIAYVEMMPNLAVAELRQQILSIRHNVELEAKLIDDLLDVTRIGSGKLELHREVLDIHSLATGRPGDLPERDRGQEVGGFAGAEGRGPSPLGRSRPHAADLLEPDQERHEVHARRGPPQLPLGGRRCGADGDRGGRHGDRHRAGGPAADLRRLRAGGSVRHATARRPGPGPGDRQDAGGIARRDADGHQRRSVCRLRLQGGTGDDRRAEGSGPATRSGRGGGGGLHKVLLVDDNAETLSTIARLLRSSDFDVRTAVSVKSAFAALDSERFDLLVSDIGLPDGSGLDIMRHGRDHLGLKGIALSGYGTDQDARTSKEAGFAHHLIKPSDLGRLVDLIRRMAS